MTAYYNEIDPFAAAWLRNLMAAGLIPGGEVDERSILDVDADDLRGFRQCHFFAGIAGWPRAIQLAGYEDIECWSGSPPCQPLSCAGQQKGHADERHLWPAFFRLIEKRRPSMVFGEQVSGALGLEWFAGVRADLEDAGYACGGADLCAAGVGAPHIRQRLFWCAVENAAGCGSQGKYISRNGETWASGLADRASDCSGMDNTMRGRHGTAGEQVCAGWVGAELSRRNYSDMADADKIQRGWWAEYGERFAYGDETRRDENNGQSLRSGEDNFWSDVEWLTGADGKARRVKPGVPLLAHGISNRVGRLRGYGNAIVPPLAAKFIQAVMECRP